MEKKWYYPLWHPIVRIVDDEGKTVAIDITGVQLDLEYVEP